MSQSMEQFGKYILFERIAAGGMAEVYLSKSLGAVGVNKFVAIKRILPQYSDHREFIEMFKEEAKIAVNLNHGNVVSIHDFGVEKNQFFLVMEYVEGKNLRQILNELKRANHKFTLQQVIYIIKEVAAGLDHAHRCVDGATGKPLNIAHRDMSPQNIMISFEGEVKIIDFGIAKAETQMEATKAGTLKGKYGYMSPEQAEGEPIDGRTDIFSLGIVFWELLANDRLFSASNESAILRKIRECQVTPIRKINPTVPPELESILNKTLAKDKDSRYQTASALYRDLNLYLNTNFPDFSQHEFSVFLKNIFSSTFLEQRNKLIEYAKINGVSNNENTFLTQTETDSFAPPEFPNPKKQTLNKPQNKTQSDQANQDENLQIDLSSPSDVKLEITDLKTATGLHKNKESNSSVKKLNTGPISYSPGLGNSNYSIPNKSRTNTGTSNFMGRMAAAILKTSAVFIFIAGCLWAFMQYGKEKKQILSLIQYIGVDANTDMNIGQVKNKETHLSAPKELEKKQAGGTQISSEAPVFNVQIRSNPDKARIIIDGEDLDSYTPFTTKMKADTPVTIRLVKEGYRDFVTSYTPISEAETVEGNLQRLARVASLYVKIINGGVNPELKISGIPVKIKPESEPYIIQADLSLKVQATNKVTGLSDEKTVLIHADQKDIVELYLK